MIKDKEDRPSPTFQRPWWRIRIKITTCFPTTRRWARLIGLITLSPCQHYYCISWTNNSKRARSAQTPFKSGERAESQREPDKPAARPLEGWIPPCRPGRGGKREPGQAQQQMAEAVRMSVRLPTWSHHRAQSHPPPAGWESKTRPLPHETERDCPRLAQTSTSRPLFLKLLKRWFSRPAAALSAMTTAATAAAAALGWSSDDSARARKGRGGGAERADRRSVTKQTGNGGGRRMRPAGWTVAGAERNFEAPVDREMRLLW